jgi:hypothetical protein
MSTRLPPDPELVARLSMSITRLARRLSQPQPPRSRPATAAAPATIVTQGPNRLGDLAAAAQVSPSDVLEQLTVSEGSDPVSTAGVGS